MADKGEIFRETLLKQIKDYLDGKISKEEYYEIAEPFYSGNAHYYSNPLFHECFLATVPDACLFYIEEPGLCPEEREKLFYEAMNEAYLDLQKF